MKRVLVSILVAVLCAGTLVLAVRFPDAGFDTLTLDRAEAPLEPSAYVLANFEAETGARNAVAAIYLTYRVYDTLFEALLLLIAIIGIMHFFRIGAPRDRDE